MYDGMQRRDGGKTFRMSYSSTFGKRLRVGLQEGEEQYDMRDDEGRRPASVCFSGKSLGVVRQPGLGISGRGKGKYTQIQLGRLQYTTHNLLFSEGISVPFALALVRILVEELNFDHSLRLSSEAGFLLLWFLGSLVRFDPSL